MIDIKDLTVSFKAHPALHHITVNIGTQSTCAILGPNGAGKSTLLKTIMGLIQPQHGNIKIDLPLHNIAYLPQQADIDRQIPLNVAEFILMGGYPKTGLWRKIPLHFKSQLVEALAQVGLEGFESRSIHTLSNGQFQRVLFARVLLQDATLILLDEPFSAVDSKTTQDLCALIPKWQAEGKTVVAVLHNFQQAQQYFDQSLLLARELIAYGHTTAVLCEHNLKQAYQTALFWQDGAAWCIQHDNKDSTS